MEGYDNIKYKKLAHLMSYIAYKYSLDEHDKSIDCCFFAFFDLYADEHSTSLLLLGYLKDYFTKYFNDEIQISIVNFFEQKKLYNCKEDKLNIILLTPSFGYTEARCENFRKQKSRKFEPNLLKIGNFYRVITGEEKMDITIENFIDTVTTQIIDTTHHCQNEAVLEFLQLFFSSKKSCDQQLSSFLNTFKDELNLINQKL